MDTVDPKNVRPRRDWVSVLAEKRIKKYGLLELPEQELGIEKVDEGTGIIVRVGPSDYKAKHCGLAPGQRIVFRGFLKEANRFENLSSDEKWEDGTPKRYFMMAIDDIQAVAESGLAIGMLSGRPQVPERK